MALDSEVPFRPSEAMFRRQETLLKLAVDSIQEAPRDEQVLSGRLSEESGCCCSIS